ncbi:hypothetical protein L484_007299 [Morus notabilis]|uniref:Uncharacterized protein n=1 Tax=Morus notabilis TaxID=981085 RepID=W9QLU2_9ROSA|nr:hypothetical protein L484_007299 [Morus notabilis]
MKIGIPLIGSGIPLIHPENRLHNWGPAQLSSVSWDQGPARPTLFMGLLGSSNSRARTQRRSP